MLFGAKWKKKAIKSEKSPEVVKEKEKFYRLLYWL